MAVRFANLDDPRGPVSRWHNVTRPLDKVVVDRIADVQKLAKVLMAFGPLLTGFDNCLIHYVL